MSLCQRYEDEWELLLLGTLDPPTSTSMKAHIDAGCATCRLRWAEATSLLGAMGASLNEAEPPRGSEERLQQRLVAQSSERAPVSPVLPKPSAHPWWPPLAAAAAVVMMVAGILLAVQNADLRRRLAEADRRAASAAAPPGGMPAEERTSEAGPASTPAPVPSHDAGEPEAVGPEATRSARERKRLEEAVRRAERARTSAEAEVARLTRSLAEAEGPGETAPAVAATEGHRQTVGEEEAIVRLTAQVRQLEAEAQLQSERAREYAAAMQAALDERATRVTLRAIDPAAGRATASATLTPEGRLLLLARGLPALPKDKCYQLWVIRRDDPAIVSAGVLTVSGQGQALHTAQIEGAAERITGFALTDEPLGGSRAARGHKLLFGSVR